MFFYLQRKVYIIPRKNPGSREDTFPVKIFASDFIQ